ncbi:MAG: DinB family protein [Planctomycetaceae bacterium]|nr:DinB family protein [Planctomycetaceae bacterium]
MTPQEAIAHSIASCQMVVDYYLADLTEEETLHRPGPGLNHIRWQMGHLIASENRFMELAFPGSMPNLPEGLAERYTKETSDCDDAAQFDSFADLKRLATEQRTATLQTLANCSSDRLSQETGIEYAPKVVDLFVLTGTHALMHAGQWAVIRRQLGRPPLF